MHRCKTNEQIQKHKCKVNKQTQKQTHTQTHFYKRKTDELTDAEKSHSQKQRQVQ